MFYKTRSLIEFHKRTVVRDQSVGSSRYPDLLAFLYDTGPQWEDEIVFLKVALDSYKDYRILSSLESGQGLFVEC